MLAEKQNLVQEVISVGTGAAIGLSVTSAGIQTGLRIWFADLGRPRSPIVDLIPTGLKRHRATLTFGDYSRETMDQMRSADDEEKELARALVRSISKSAHVTVGNHQSLDDWVVDNVGFSITVEKANIDNRFDDDALVEICGDIVTPLLGAMAELYGYDVIDNRQFDVNGELEGAVLVSVVRRRERNPRNRLLCLRIHGSVCMVCGLNPKATYGEAGSIIEVHHVQPLSNISEPRNYNPESDLVPLCPSCHRAIHTRRPTPWSLVEIREHIKIDER